MIQTTGDRKKTIATLRGLLEGMQVVMLTTRGSDGRLRSRPMAPVPHEFDGDLWFFTLDDSPQVSEVQERCEANVSYSAPAQHQFVSISGAAQVVRDRRKLELLWKDELQSEFTLGLATPNLALLQFSAEEAEFWDQRLSSGSGFLSAMVSWKGTLQDVHEKIDWHQGDPLDAPVECASGDSVLTDSPETNAQHPSEQEIA